MAVKYDVSWGSHLPILIKVTNISRGPVLEMGMGLFSTPVLHWLCIDQKRQLVSYDNSMEYYETNKSLESPSHKILYVDKDDWDSADIDNTHWGLVFIDHHPTSRRGIDVLRLANKADYIVIHDSNRPNNHFHYDEAYPHFKYRYNWKRQRPHTTVLSNFYDLSSL